MTARPLPEAVERVIKGIDPLKAIADWENADDIAFAVKAYVVAQMRPAIAAAMAPGEPVAWGVFNGTSFKCAYDDERAAREDYPRYAVVPLYAAPPAPPVAPVGCVAPLPPTTEPEFNPGVPLTACCVCGAPDVAESVRDALAKVDVEVTDRRDDGTHVYTVLGVREVEAAHRAEVDALHDLLRQANVFLALLTELGAVNDLRDRIRAITAPQAGTSVERGGADNPTPTGSTPVKAPLDDAEIGSKRYVVAVFHHPEHAGKAREFRAEIKYWDPSWSGFCGTHKVVAKNGRDARRIAINAEREKRGLEPK